MIVLKILKYIFGLFGFVFLFRSCLSRFAKDIEWFEENGFGYLVFPIYAICCLLGLVAIYLIIK